MNSLQQEQVWNERMVRSRAQFAIGRKRTERIGAVFFLLFVPALLSSGFPGPLPQDLHSPSQRKTLMAVRTSAPVVIDGDLSDAAWESVPTADEFVQAEPHEGQRATEKTEVRVLYDEENLYIGVYCHDSEPARIVVNSLKEDFPPNDTDSFWVVLDTFLDKRNGFVFVTNPQGAKRDVQTSNEGRTANEDWDTVWDVRAQVNGDGWSAEMVIPFKSLSFDEKHPQQVWGINFSRRIRRKNEVDYWAPVPRRYDISRVSLAGEMKGLEGIERGRNLRIKPFVVADLNKRFARDSIGANFDGGVDAKYSVTPSLTLDLTGNTDFSQVEVDEQQINLTRFPLFFPEKREFFLENAGIFQFGDIPGERGPNRSKETQLFFSRRIGLSATGQPIPIWGGPRLSGQIGKYSLGLLTMQTKDFTNQPGNNFSVVRLKRNVLANSDIGVLFINRQASGGDDFHRTWGADANFRFGQNLTFNGYVAKTHNDGLPDRNLAHKITGEWRDNFTRFQMVYTDIEENFEPEVGFTQRQGVRIIRNRIELKPRPRNNTVIREINPHYTLTYFMDQSNRTVTKEFHIGIIEVFFHNGSRFEFLHDPSFDRLDQPFRIRPGIAGIRPEIAIPPGDYRYGQWGFELESDPSKTLLGSFNYKWGGFYSGNITTLSVSGTIRPSYRFSVKGQYTRNGLVLREGAFTTHLFSSRTDYYFNTRMFLTALIQYNSDLKQVTSNIRFTFIHHPLSDLFLVYNELRDVSGAGRTDRTATLKFTHLLSF